MLESIRAGAQSFGVKVAFGVIILVFVFWGVGNFNDRDYSNVVAVVNGQPILAMEFARAYQNAEEYILRNNPGVTREQLAREHLGRQVLRDLVTDTLLAQEAARAGVSVSPAELRRRVGQVEAFQDESGKFDPEVYQRVLAAQRMTPGQYEQGLSEEMLKDKMFDLITAPAWVDANEARARYNYLGEQRRVSYVFVPASKFQADVKVTDEQARNWYEGHTADFAIPAQVDIEYIALEPADLVDKATIGEEAARKWYEDNRDRFAVPEEVKAAHILVPLAPDADEDAANAAREKMAAIQQELASGRPFAEVADEYNEEGAADKGGELGWFGRGVTIPEFEEAAFAQEPGTVSEVIRTPFGLHIILVEDKRAAGVKPFEEVADQAYHALAAEAGTEKINDALDSLIEDNIMQRPLTESAARYNLQAVRSGNMDRVALMQKLGLNAEGADALLGLPAGSPLDTPLEAGDKYIVARVVSALPAGTKSFEEAKGEIEKLLVQDGADNAALAEAESLLKKLQAEPGFDLANEELKSDVMVSRGGSVGEFAANRSLNEAIFGQKPLGWLGKPFSVASPAGEGAILVRVDGIETPDEETFESVREFLANSAKQERMEALYSLFLQHLGERAKIEITNQDMIDRVGR